MEAMAPVEATIVDAGGRDLRVSNPDRVIFPATERTAAVTKLDIVEYYLAVADGIMRALRRRPTTLERWPKGVHPGIVVSTREKGGGDAFFQKRVPRGAPDYVQTVQIQFQSGSHGSFSTVKTLSVTDPRGYFDLHTSLPASGSVRLAWTYPSTDPFLPTDALGVTVYSRSQKVSIR